MTNHDLTIWMVFGSVSFIAFMVTLWLLLKANRKIANKLHAVEMQHALDNEHYERLVQEQHDELAESDYDYDDYPDDEMIDLRAVAYSRAAMERETNPFYVEELDGEEAQLRQIRGEE